MTATAFALDPATDDYGTCVPLAPRRPELRLIDGHGSGSPEALAGLVAGVVPPRRVRPAVSVEVYRRRRFLALMAATVLILAVAWVAGVSVLSFGSAAPGVSAEPAPAVHVVLPGDTYAAIAADLGAVDPVAAAEQLRDANGGSELVVGQRLVVEANALGAQQS